VPEEQNILAKAQRIEAAFRYADLSKWYWHTATPRQKSDAEWILNRYTEMPSGMTFEEARTTAKVDFIMKVLAE